MLSVIIIAKNEELCLRRCLESIKWVNEIIVLDSGSTDNTLLIAREYTQKVYATDWQGYGIQKQRALSYATNQWVLNLDADEWVDDALKDEIITAITQKSTNEAYRIPIRMEFYGKPLRFSSSPSRHIRLFKRQGARYSNDIVHEKIVLEHNKIGKLKHAIKHDSFRDLEHALQKMNKYSSYSAKIRIEQKKATPHLLQVIGASSWMFVRAYLLQCGFLDGKAGFVLACLNAQSAFYRHLKQLYPDRNLDNLPIV